jgi:hypothetical protein
VSNLHHTARPPLVHLYTFIALAMDFDEVPAGPSAGGASNAIPNAGPPPPTEDDYSDVPFEALLQDGNWKARKAAFDRVVTNAPDMQPDAFAALLPKLVKDVTTVFDSFAEALAAFLEADALPSAADVAALVTVAMVDKGLVGRPRAAAAATRVLHNLVRCGQAAAVNAALTKAMAAKAPKARAAALTAAASIVSKYGVEALPLKPLVKTALPLFNDTDAKVRKEVTGLIVECYRYVGAAIEPAIEELRDVQKQELMRRFEEVKTPQRAVDNGHAPPVGPLPASSVMLRSAAAADGPKSAPGVARAAPRSAKPATTATPFLSTNSTPTAAAAVAPRRVAASAGQNNAADAKSVKAAVNVLDEGLYSDGAMDPDVAACVLRDHLRPVDLAAADALDLLKSKEWRGRADAAALIETAAAQIHGEAASAAGAAFVAVLRGATQWSECMFQVVNANAKAITQFVVNAADLSPWATYAIVTGFGPRFAEAKSRQYVIDLLVAVTDHVGPKLVARLLCAIAAEQKSPRTTTEVLGWIEFALRSYVSAPVDAKGLVDFIREHVFEQPNPAAKASGVKVLVALRARVGSRFDSLIGDINPHLRKSYEVECIVADTNPQPVPTRVASHPLEVPRMLAKVGKAAHGAAHAGIGAASGAVAESNDFPPEDISSQLAAAVRNFSHPSDWRTRSQGLKAIDDAVNAARRSIAPAGVDNAFKALKGRYDEPNKNFVTDALRMTALLADAIFPPSGARFGLKLVFPAAASMLGDQKQALRDEATRVCRKAVQVVGLEQVLAHLVKPLASDNQHTRAAAAELVLEAFQAGQHVNFAPRTMTPLVMPLLKMFVDRNSDIRSRAESAFAFVLPNVGFDVVARSVTDFKLADQKLIGPTLDRIRSVAEPRPAAPPIPAQPLPTAGAPSSQHGPDPSMSHRGTHQQQPHAAPQQHADPYPTLPAQPPVGPPRARTGISLSEINAGLKTARASAVPQLCTDLNAVAAADAADVMAIDFRTVDALLSRARSLFASGLATPDDQHAATCVLGVLRGLLQSPQFAAGLVSNELHAFFDCVFGCILSDAAEVISGGTDDMIRPLHVAVAQTIQHANADGLVDALFRLTMDYCGRDLAEPTPLNSKFLDLALRCIQRTKDIRRPFSAERILVAANDFLSEFPPSRLHDRSDRPIRYVKILL